MQNTLDTLFNTQQSCWTDYCGIVCLNPSITITPTFITIDQRMIVCEVQHTHHMFEPFTIAIL